jgi:hypothetical protein
MPAWAVVPAPHLEAAEGASMSRSETVEDKAGRLLLAGRVRVLEVIPGRALVQVEGDTGRWTVAYRRGRWGCPCPAPGWRRCSHLAAAELVVGRPGNAAAAAR